MCQEGWLRIKQHHGNLIRSSQSWLPVHDISTSPPPGLGKAGWGEGMLFWDPTLYLHIQLEGKSGKRILSQPAPSREPCQERQEGACSFPTFLASSSRSHSPANSIFQYSFKKGRVSTRRGKRTEDGVNLSSTTTFFNLRGKKALDFAWLSRSLLYRWLIQMKVRN